MKHVTGFRRGLFLVLAVVLFLPGSGSGKSALQYTAEGDRYMLKGDYRKAVFSYRNALQRNQAHLKALIGIGNAWTRLDSADAALRSFEKALKIDEKSVEALTGIGFILTHRGDSRRAIEYFNRAITISRESPAAHYGLAWLYYTMGKMIWARRRAESLLAVHPLHFDTLLLMADIIAREGDLEEAKKYAWKAIDAQPERTGGYLRLAAIMFRDYTLRGNGDSLDEASKAVDNALVINADSPDANMLRGLMLWYEKKYADAAAAFEKALGQKNSVDLYYSLAITRDSLGAADAALKNFLEAMKLDPVDPVLRSRFEQFMVVRDIKAGHPARAMFFRESLEAGKKRMKQNLPDEAVLYLRRTLLLNPMSREARELLMGYYEALSYNRFYIRELKEMQRLYPGTNTRDRLTAAVYRRRSRMYHREGFSGDDLPRDVPRILVLDFHSEEGVGPHPDLGAVSAFDLTWALAQFGRQEPVPVRARLKAAGLKMTPAGFAGTMDRLEEMTKKKAIAPFDYLLYGSCRCHRGRIFHEREGKGRHGASCSAHGAAYLRHGPLLRACSETE